MNNTHSTIVQKIIHYAKEIFIFLLIVILLSNILSYYRSTSLNKGQFPLDNIDLHDKPILIHFWSTWCPTCKIEAPNIQTISNYYNVVTIAVQSGDNKKVEKYLQNHQLSFKVIIDEKSHYARKFNISVFPTTLIYDKKGNLIFSEVGYTSTVGLYLRLYWASL